MSRRKLFSAIGVIAILATLFLSLGAAPGDPREGTPEHPQSGYARSPLHFKQIATPAWPDRPGKESASNAVTYYPPSSIQQAYNFGTFAKGGSGKAIAIVDAYGDPNLTTDVAAFDKYFGLAPITLNVYHVDGISGRTNSGWAIETALDVEWAHANAQGATIDVVVAPDSSFSHLLDAVNYAAKLTNVAAISMSWGAPENGQGMSSVIASYDSAFKTITSSGIILLAASGDAGAYDGTNSLTVDYPASSIYTIGVGGTTLTLNSSGGYGTEVAWKGSGGGYSAFEARQTWQSSANPSNTKRGVPDVAFDADPNSGVYTYYHGNWYAVGGTSVGAPNWAAIVTDSAAAGTALNLPHLYGVYGSKYSTEIHDVASGNNGYYSAGSGWDPVTGIGTPNVSNMITGK